MISYMALISTPGMMCGKVLANPVSSRIKMKVPPRVEVALIDNNRQNRMIVNLIKITEIAKEWMHGCVTKNS